MNLGIIGLGLIGSSIALNIKQSSMFQNIFGVDENKQHESVASEMGLVQDVMPMDVLLNKCDVIAVCIPVDKSVIVVKELLDHCKEQTIFDVGSVKRNIVNAMNNHPNRKNFVATHPMAGTEFSGPTAAKENLFQEKAVIFCDVEHSGKNHLELVQKIYSVLGMRYVEMNAAEHDKHVAFISHLSHLSSFSLALSVLDEEKSEKDIFHLASGGFASTVRLAKSNPDTWASIFLENNFFLLEALDVYIQKIEQFREALKNSDEAKLHSLMQEANEIKRIKLVQ